MILRTLRYKYTYSSPIIFVLHSCISKLLTLTQIPFQRMTIVFQTKDQAIINEVNNFIDSWETLAGIEIQTSGSTGKPKTISIKKEYLIESAKMTGAYLGLKQSMSAFLCLSPKTIAGKMMIIRSIVLDLELTVGEISSMPFANNDASFDFAAMVPMQVESCIKQGINLSEIGKLIIGGAPISQNLWETITEKGLSAYQTFGMTETISHVAMRKISGGSDASYKALPNVSFTENDSKLVISAPHLGVEQLETSDFIELLSPTEFKWKGRADFVINSGGIKIHPEEIEQTLSSIITNPFFSFGLEDERLGQKLALCIEGDISISKETLTKMLNKHFIPKEVYFFEKLHYTESNKINRLATIKDISNARKQVL